MVGFFLVIHHHLHCSKEFSRDSCYIEELNIVSDAVHLEYFLNVALYEVVCNFPALARYERQFCAGNNALHRKDYMSA